MSRHHNHHTVFLACLFLALTGFACSQPKKPTRATKGKPPASSTQPPAPTTTAAATPASPKAPPPSHHQDGKQLSLRVVSVHDGDTLRGLDDAKTQHKIRLHGIDAPETDQRYGQASKQALSSKAFGKDVVVVVKDTDRYGRTVGHVFVDGRDVNREMLEDGMAWHYMRYDNSLEFQRAEQSARAAKKGLWREKNPVPPWDWRKGETARKEE